jgi:hypothetical protein
MSDPIVNPSLLKPISPADFAQHEHSGVRASDTDGDKRITEADRFTYSGRQAGADIRDRALADVCGEIAGRDTSINVTDEAGGILKRNNASVSQFRTATGNRYAELKFGGNSVRSYGGYDSEFRSCHYNRTGLDIGRGRSGSEISISYEDATGKHQQYLNLKTGNQTKVK